MSLRAHFEQWVDQGTQDLAWAQQFPEVDFPRVHRAVRTLGEAELDALLLEGDTASWRRLPAWRQMEAHQRAFDRRVQQAEQGILDPKDRADLAEVFTPPQRAVTDLPVALARILTAWLDYDPPDESDLVQGYLEGVARYAVRGVYGEGADTPPFSGETAIGLSYQGVIPAQVNFLLVRAYSHWRWTQWVAQVRAHAASTPLPTPEPPSAQAQAQVSLIAQIDSERLRGVYESLAEHALRQACFFLDAHHFQWLLDAHADGPAWLLRRLQTARDLWELGLDLPPETQDVDQLRSWVNHVWENLDMSLAGPLLEILGWEGPKAEEKSGVYVAPAGDQPVPKDALQLAEAVAQGGLTAEQRRVLARFPVRTTRSIYHLDPEMGSASGAFIYVQDETQVRSGKKQRSLSFSPAQVVQLLRGETLPLVVRGVGSGHYFIDFRQVAAKRAAEEAARLAEEEEETQEVQRVIRRELHARQAQEAVSEDDPDVVRFIELRAEADGTSQEEIRGRFGPTARTFVYSVRQRDREYLRPILENLQNKVSRKMFGEMVGRALPATMRGTQAFLGTWGRILPPQDVTGYRYLSLTTEYRRAGSPFLDAAVRKPLLAVSEADPIIQEYVDYARQHPEITIVRFTLRDEAEGKVIARYGPEGQLLSE